MSSANTSIIEEDGFGLIERPDSKLSKDHRCHEIVRRYTMTNKGKSSVRLITWGAAIQSIRVPNNKKIFGDVVLGYDSMDGYLKDKYFGNITGQLTNRVSSDGEISMKNIENDSRKYMVKKRHSFEKINWESCIVGNQVVMSNISNASVNDWPGDMLTQVKFSWTDDNELHINIRASTTNPMPVNVTTRCLFNLAGHGTGPNELRNHVVTMNASKWTLVDVRDKIPTGHIIPVYSTIYDLRNPTRLSKERLRKVPGGGYDHNFCIEAPATWCYRFHARILHPGSGRFMEIYSNQPGLHFYTGNDLPESGQFYKTNIEDCCSGDCGDRFNNNIGINKKENFLLNTQMKKEIRYKDGVIYHRHGGFSSSPQNYPNSLNTEGFPTCILYPGKIYTHDMTYKFGVNCKF